MLSVIIPVYNEERTVSEVIDKVLSSSLPTKLSLEIIAINDGSTDGTRAILDNIKYPQLRVFHQETNRGKTSAVRKGIFEAKGSLIIIQDADLEYSPVDYAAIIQKMDDTGAEVVYGSRFLGEIKDMAPINWMANRISNIVFNLKFKTNITDINTCFKLFKADVLKQLTIESDHFGFETEVTTKLIRQGVRIIETPISYHARTKAEGKKIDWAKAVQMFLGMFRY